MSHPDALVTTAAQLTNAKSYSEVFGPLSGATLPERRQALRHQFSFLARVVHPDHNPPGSQTKAQEVFRLLNQMRSAADAALASGTYERPFGANPAHADSAISGPAEFEIRSSKGVYHLQNATFARGDFSVLYRGRRAPPGDLSVIAKVSSAPTNNPWLERDAAVLDRFWNVKKGDPLVGIQRFVPEVIDTFFIEGKNHTRFRVTVMKEVPDLVSVTDIITAYPNGIDPRDAAWIYRRIIAQTLAASMAGVVHGAMVPDHVLVDPYKHEPLHIGWAHAVDASAGTPGRITHLIDRWKDCYPPEVFEKKKPTHQTDLYMAAKTMILLLGGDGKRNTLPASVPKSVGEVILRSVEPTPARRPEDGKLLLDDFTRVIRQEWGRSYRPLMMPVR